MEKVVKNYVEALYSLLNNDGDRNQLEEDLRTFVDVYKYHEGLRSMLNDPRLTLDVKYEIIDDIFVKDNLNLAKFIKLLIKNSRINLIEEMLVEYEKVNRIKQKELLIRIIVSSEIDDNQIEKIVNKFKKMYKVNTVKYSVEIDKNILGGIKVFVGNTVYDASIRRQVEGIF